MTTATTTNIDQLAINTIRFLAVDGVEKAKSGHPGMPMGMAPVAYTLWTRHLNFNSKNANWANRDRFVLSNGHGSMLLYAMLHLTGYDVSLDDLKNFRQWHSKTPGHPEFGDTDGVETTTGPLGQGIATAVGMAMGKQYVNKMLGKDLFDYKIYGIVGDGCLQEGVGAEGISLAGHLGLSDLIFFYDDNSITIDGPTSLSFSDNIPARFKAHKWNVLEVSDANDIDLLDNAIRQAKTEQKKPTLIVTKSIIGFGSPNKANTAGVHGAALGPDEVKATKENLSWPLEPTFLVPDEVKKHFDGLVAKGQKAEAEWNEKYAAWKKVNPKGAKLYERILTGKLPADWEKAIPTFEADDKMATRQASGKVINAIAPLIPELIGGSADLAPSNNTLIKNESVYSTDGAGRNFHFGVREHGMAAALNGLALTPGLIPYGGTFFVFADYMKGGMRLSALMKQRVIYVLTHDSIGLGEDGPTHQPIEQAAQLRATPNFTLFRPADATETAAAWKWALNHKTGPTGLALSRQGLPVLKKSAYPSVGQVEKGGYILSDAAEGKPQVILIASGSEVHLALGAQENLRKEKIEARVVSMPCPTLFDQQDAAYKESVLPKAVTKRVSIEALSTFGWDRYTGLDGAQIGMTSFGASAPGNVAMEKFGFTVNNVVTTARNLLK